MSLFISISILPTVPVLGLGLIENTNVIYYVIAKCFHKFGVIHACIKPGTRPVSGAIPITIPVIALRRPTDKLSAATYAKKVTHSPTEAFHAIRTTVDRDSARTHIVSYREIVLRIGPVVLQVREFS